MTDYEINAFHSEFDPVEMAQSFREDTSLQNKAKHFAVLKTAYFLVYSKGAGQVSVLNNKDSAMIAAFTSAAELEKWPFDKLDVREITYTELKRLVDGNPKLDGIVINPFGQALLLKRPHLADIENVMRSVTPRKELKLHATLDYPIGLPLAVEKLMEEHPEVYRVWIMAARGENEHADHKLFVVDFDGEREPLFPLLAQAVRLYLRQNETLELIKADISLLRICEEASKPIYTKKQ